MLLNTDACIYVYILLDIARVINIYVLMSVGMKVIW